MGTVGQEIALWNLGHQRWSQNLGTGAFDLVDFRDLGAPANAWHVQDVATLIGARISVDSADCGTRPAALYPGEFKFSPITGRALPEPLPARSDVWLPPFGGEGATLAKPQGLRLCEVSLRLPPSLTIESPPDAEIPLPPAGNYQFLVGSFTTRAPGLLAIEFSRGLVYCWLPGTGAWEEILPGEGDILGESLLGNDTWGMAGPDLVGSNQVFLPTNRGLAAVSVNLIALRYSPTLVGGRCIGAPAVWQGGLYVPIQEADGRVAVHAFDPQTLDAIDRLDTHAGGTEVLQRPIIDRRQIIWMSAAGQLIVKQTGAPALEVSFLPWTRGLAPRFDLGSPYVSADGHIWQQCIQENASGGQFVFVQLGRSQPDIIQPTSSPRLSTGSSSFRLEALLRANPWADPDEGMDSHADEVIIPLLESLSHSTLLCARVPSTSSIESVFASDAPCMATFELRGERDVRFAVKRLSRPWITRPFVFAGCLHLYHPDLPSMPGWRMN